MEEKVVGLIGVGKMGKLMMGRLQKNGYTVVACDALPAAKEYIKEQGAVPAETGADVARQARIILMSLPKPAHVLSMVQNMLDELTEDHVLVDTSTVDPLTSQKNAELVFSAKKAGYVDAPILGRPMAIGSWMMPVGGQSQFIDKAEPVLLNFVTKLARVGGPGCGNAIKILNNTMFSTINGISAEIMEIAYKCGVDINVFYETIAGSSAGTVSGLFRENGRRICDDRYDDPDFTIELMCKDAGLGLHMAKASGIHPVITSTVLALNENARDNGFAHMDTSAMYLYFKKLYEA